MNLKLTALAGFFAFTVWACLENSVVVSKDVCIINRTRVS